MNAIKTSQRSTSRSIKKLRRIKPNGAKSGRASERCSSARSTSRLAHAPRAALGSAAPSAPPANAASSAPACARAQARSGGWRNRLQARRRPVRRLAGSCGGALAAASAAPRPAGFQTGFILVFHQHGACAVPHSHMTLEKQWTVTAALPTRTSTHIIIVQADALQTICKTPKTEDKHPCLAEQPLVQLYWTSRKASRVGCMDQQARSCRGHHLATHNK